MQLKHRFTSVSALGLFVSIAMTGSATGQLTPTSPLSFVAEDVAGLYDQTLDEAFSTSESLEDGYSFNLQGHASMTYQVGQSLTIADGLFEEILLARQFEVGEIPVEVAPVIHLNGKIVNSGDPFADVVGDFQVRVRIRESGTVDLNESDFRFSDFANLGAPLVDDSQARRLTGNGFRILDEEIPADPVVLTPGVELHLGR